MAGSFIAIDIPNLPAVRAKLARLPGLVADEGVDEANKYILNSVRHYAAYRYVSRASVFGQTFQSDKQRRWFFANLKDGNLSIPYHRTQRLSGGWKIIGSGINSLVANEVRYAGLMQGNSKTEQGRHAKAIGWKGIDVLLDERAGEILRRFSAGVKKAIRILGL